MRTSIMSRLTAQRVIPVLRFGSAELGREAVDCLFEAGFDCVELTLTMPGAMDLIADLKRVHGDRVLAGAGTVLDAAQARDCLDAGADFLVAPCFVEGMVAAAHQGDRPALMGGFTPGEVLQAHRDRADMVKLFPAATGGPSHLAALIAVFPSVLFCPTGGVSLGNMADWFKAGAAVVGVGNSIIDQKALASGARAQVVAQAREYLERRP